MTKHCMEKELSSQNWRLVINLQGGRIEELSYENNQILGTFDRKDGKKGHTHICTPNFNMEGTVEYGLPPHGNLRNMEWHIKTEDDSYLSIYCNVPATHLYKAELYVEQIFELDKSFKHTVIVENTLGETVPVNIGIHNYWTTPGGWEGTKVNGLFITSEVINNGQMVSRKSNTIAFPDGRRFRLKLSDLHYLKLWTSSNINKEFDSDYVCIEPVLSLKPDYFGSKQSLLKEGKAMGASQEISLL